MAVFGGPLHKIDREIYEQTLLPHHGPGSTADALVGNQKWTLPEWTDRLQQVFPYLEYALPSHSYWRFGEADKVKFLSPSQERPVKLTAVAKTHTTPRLIAIEPTCMQYVQQAIARPLCDLIERDSRARHFTGFSDQWPNQAMAQGGSDDGSLATLDLSEASDRVANWIVEDLFADVPHFLEGIEACRSRTVKLPSGEIHHLLKYASMGSALTFPIEAMVFTSIVLEACARADGRSPSAAAFKRYRSVVRVYGDDIIVPAHMAETVIESLEAFGLKVNRNKSFWTGGFRESCGKEYWKGYDVSIVKVRKALPTSRRDVDELVSTVATRNLFFSSGLEETAALLDEVIEPLLRFYPYVAETSPVLGRHHAGGLYQIDGMTDDTHAPYVRGYVVKSKIPENEIEDHHALMKVFLESIGKRNADPGHLTRSGRPRAVSIKLAKASPF